MKKFDLRKSKAKWQSYLLPASLLVLALGIVIFSSQTVLAGNTSSFWARFDYLLPSQNQQKTESEVIIPDTESMPSIVPVSLDDGWVSSEFGPRKRHPVTGRKNVMHYGIDFAVYTGTPVKAAADGVVTLSGRKGGYGLIVIIDHLNGVETRYAHNSRLKAKEGDSVKKGDIVAYSGSTGVSTGPHLHYEVRVAGKATNPRNYMAGLPPTTNPATGETAIGASK